MSADWPQWRGPSRDGISLETGLLKEWPQAGPEVLWNVDSVGTGYSSVSVSNGRLFTLGNIDGEGRILCLDAADGSVIWSVKSPTETAEYKHGKGDGARGTPTVDGEFVYVEGGGGRHRLLERAVWRGRLVKAPCERLRRFAAELGFQ